MMMNGKVKWFSNVKGFGFIESPVGPDIFVHYTEIQADGYKALKGGMEVDFELFDAPRGPMARNVRRLRNN
jgi:CspA family cold shock protein